MNKGVIITRPLGYNDTLGRLLCEKGYRVLERPLLSIKPINFTRAMKYKVMNLNTYDAIIFVSRNAVSHSLSHLRNFWPKWPADLIWCAMGEKTAEDLNSHAVVVNYPEEQGAEGLFNTIDWQDINKVLIIRGKGGLETLHDRLRRRLVNVDYLEVYERVSNRYSELEQEIVDLNLEVVVLTSGDALQSLCASVGSDALTKLTALVPTERIGELVKQSGIKKLAVSGSLSDEAVLNTLDSI